MDIPLKKRQLYPDEQRMLKALKRKKEKEISKKIRYYYFLIAGLLGISFTYLAIITIADFLVLLFGTIAILAYGFIIFIPYEIYKDRKKLKAFLNELNAFIDAGTVCTYFVHAKRIAIAKEYEDEGDLFIIEYGIDKIFYLWDCNYNLRKKFPCLDFEIYEDIFFKLFGRQVYPLSGSIKPLIIDRKAKWKYMSKVGVPRQLETQNISFDKLIEEYNN